MMLLLYFLLLVLLVAILLASLSSLARSLNSKMDTIHALVNSQKTVMLREISDLKGRIAQLLPGDDEAQRAAQEAHAEINGRVVTDALLSQAVEPLRKK